MSNALGVSPAVMINRLVDRAATPQGAQLAKVAELRMALLNAVEAEKAKSAAASPDGEGQAPVVDSGAVVDRLI
ncbi:MAG TPA: hypothetical protein VL147_23655 [Devosia sp.]|nr:hypothetical protein [Devosia sp.]